jgi:hypothetical protein
MEQHIAILHGISLAIQHETCDSEAQLTGFGIMVWDGILSVPALNHIFTGFKNQDWGV